jgi:cytochrome c553
MYIGLLHTHRLVVILFLLLYVAKLILLLSEKEEWLTILTKKSKIAEMVISFLFLATGIGMLFNIAEIKMMLIIKFIAVAASIPLAIIGFKKKNKILASVAVLLIIVSYGLAEMSKRSVEKKSLTSDIVQDINSTNYDLNLHGKAVFGTYCQVCHGEEGTLGLSGAKNLQKSQLNEQEILNIITNGKGNMAGYGKSLSEQEIKAVSSYIQTLRK